MLRLRKSAQQSFLNLSIFHKMFQIITVFKAFPLALPGNPEFCYSSSDFCGNEASQHRKLNSCANPNVLYSVNSFIIWRYSANVCVLYPLCRDFALLFLFPAKKEKKWRTKLRTVIHTDLLTSLKHETTKGDLRSLFRETEWNTLHPVQFLDWIFPIMQIRKNQPPPRRMGKLRRKRGL